MAEIRNTGRFNENDDFGVPTFGRPLQNNGWIQCPSKTFPEASYYYNVDSGCKTWRRPLSSRVQIPILKQTTIREDDDFDDEVPIYVSDIENDDYTQHPRIKTEDDVDVKPQIRDIMRWEKQKKMFSEIFYKMFHFEVENCDGCEVDDFPDESYNCQTIKTEPFIKSEVISDEETFDESLLLPKISYSSSSEDEDQEIISRRKRSRGKLLSCRRRQNSISDSVISSNFGSSLENSPPRFLSSHYGESRIEKSKIQDSEEIFGKTELESENNENPIPKIFSNLHRLEKSPTALRRLKRLEQRKSLIGLPQLKNIGISDLMLAPTRAPSPPKKKPQKRKVSIDIDVTRPETPPQKLAQIIHEINGVKTISYDIEDPELPPGVKITNLSDSESSNWDRTSYCHERKNPVINIKKEIDEPTVENNRILNPYYNFKGPQLSESSCSMSSKDSSTSNSKSSSSSSSCSSCSDSDSSDSSSSSSFSDRSMNKNKIVIKQEIDSNESVHDEPNCIKIKKEMGEWTVVKSEKMDRQSSECSEFGTIACKSSGSSWVQSDSPDETD